MYNEVDHLLSSPSLPPSSTLPSFSILVFPKGSLKHSSSLVNCFFRPFFFFFFWGGGGGHFLLLLLLLLLSFFLSFFLLSFFLSFFLSFSRSMILSQHEQFVFDLSPPPVCGDVGTLAVIHQQNKKRITAYHGLLDLPRASPLSM